MTAGGGEGKSKELHVFLFEQCVIFSEAVGKKSQFVSQTYNYKAHVQVRILFYSTSVVKLIYRILVAVASISPS